MSSKGRLCYHKGLEREAHDDSDADEDVLE